MKYLLIFDDGSLRGMSQLNMSFKILINDESVI